MTPRFDMGFYIHPDVEPLRAYKALDRARGYIAEGLRFEALRQARAGVRSARTIRDGAKRHKVTKTRRDALRRIRKLEMKRRGWK